MKMWVWKGFAVRVMAMVVMVVVMAMVRMVVMGIVILLHHQ